MMESRNWQILPDTFTTGEALGTGATGDVFAATYDGKPAVVKHLKKSIAFVPWSNPWESFCSGIEASTQFRHKNVVRTYGGYAGQRVEPIRMPFVIRERLDTTLAAKLRDREVTGGQLSVEEVLVILLDICTGMNYLHLLGYMHRDLNLNNFLVSNSPEFCIKIGGLGCGKLTKDNNWENTADIGAVKYRAPEGRLTNYDRSCDIWSVGVVAGDLMAVGRVSVPKISDEVDDWFEERTDVNRAPIENFTMLMPPAILKECAFFRHYAVTAATLRHECFWTWTDSCLRLVTSARPAFAVLIGDLVEIKERKGIVLNRQALSS